MRTIPRSKDCPFVSAMTRSVPTIGVACGLNWDGLGTGLPSSAPLFVELKRNRAGLDGNPLGTSIRTVPLTSACPALRRTRSGFFFTIGKHHDFAIGVHHYLRPHDRSRALSSDGICPFGRSTARSTVRVSFSPAARSIRSQILPGQPEDLRASQSAADRAPDKVGRWLLSQPIGIPNRCLGRNPDRLFFLPQLPACQVLLDGQLLRWTDGFRAASRSGAVDRLMTCKPTERITPLP